MQKVHLAEKLALSSERWRPKVVGELNGQQVKLVKFQGPFVWHHHDHEDELFLVVKGRFRMEFRERHVWLEEGEFLVVPPWRRTSARRRGGGPCPPVRAGLDAEHRQHP